MNLSFNGIAQQFKPESLRRLQEICTPVELRAGQVLEPDDAAQRPVYFLGDSAVTLWISPLQDGPALALSVVGPEGMVGCPQMWAYPHPQCVARVFQAGMAFQTSATQLQDLLARAPDLAWAISRFLWTQTLEVAQLSARMQLGDLRTRLALWLHLLHHKTRRPTLRITHQALAEMTGIRRVSVTLTAGQLQDEGILMLGRGEIHIRDLAALARAAGVDRLSAAQSAQASQG